MSLTVFKSQVMHYKKRIQRLNFNLRTHAKLRSILLKERTAALVPLSSATLTREEDSGG